MSASPKLLLLAPVAASLALAACGSSSSGSTSSASNTSATSSAQSSATVVKTASNAAVGGTVLTTAQGLTLYRLSGEQGGKFICTSSECLQVWHPVTVTAAVTPSGSVASLSTVKRPDGTLQVTYKGLPLYTFAADRQPGEAKGQGIKDVGTWNAVTVTTTGTSAGSSATPTTSTPEKHSGYAY